MAEENLSPEEYKKLEETAIKLAQEEMAAIIAKKGKEKDMSAEDVNKAVEQYLNEPLKSGKNTEIEKEELLNGVQTTETLVDMVERVGKEVPAAKQEQELKNEMGQVKKVYVTTPGLLGLTVTSAQMTADYIKDKNIDVVNETKEFIKNAPDKAVEAVNKGVDFVQEQATKGYEAAKVGTQKGFEILKNGVQGTVDFVKGSKDRNIVSEAKEFIKNAPDTAFEAVNKGVDFVQEQATKGYEAAKVGTQKGFEILKDGVQDSVDFVKGGVNFVKDSLDYVNPFTLNDTLNNAGQKVNPDAMEQTPMLKDNSKDMA